MASATRQVDKTPMADPQGYLEHRDVLAMLDAAEDPRSYLLTRLLWRTGARIGEALLLRPVDIDWHHGIVFVPTEKKRGRLDEKTKKREKVDPYDARRMVPVDPGTVQALKRWIVARKIGEADRLFDFQRSWAFNIIATLGDRADVTPPGKAKRVHPHHFRHTFAIEYIAANGGSAETIKKLQTLLGHHSYEVTAQYLRYSKADLIASTRRMWDDVDG